MEFKDLYAKSVLKNIVGWNVATEPTPDSYIAEELVSLDYSKTLKEFIAQHPEHTASVFSKDAIFSDELDLKSIQVGQKLWQKYQEMKKTKAPADEAYFDLFDQMVAVTKEKLQSKNIKPTDLMFFNDKRLGDPSFVISVVGKMADISREFLKTKPQKEIAPRKDFTMDMITGFMDGFEDISYKITNNNGSFMTALDSDNARVHVAKNKKDIADSASSATHEVGHALYQTRVLNKRTEVGKLGDMISLSLHESSSIAHEIALSGIDFKVRERVENLYRLGTDKVHYIIHIFLRMKIEEMLFTDQIKARDIPSVWNKMVEDYIGITPNNDWEGFLQDVHWNSGAFGYFHSYAIGFLNAVTMYTEIEDQLTGEWKTDTLDIILPKIDEWYGHYNEQSHDILKDMHKDIDQTLENYKNFIFTRFSYN
jgi:Zn-dependent M32 family carboxypeptidase